MALAAQAPPTRDWRRFAEGHAIPSEGYCDQPYVVLTGDGTWLCVMTTGQGREGDPGQHVVATRSTDTGRTWTLPVDIEPADGPEASWAMPLVTPGGRVYVFYTYNKDNLRDNRSLVEAARRRVDSLGYFAYKFSDDGGRTWPADRHYLPLRNLRLDRKNPFGDAVHLFWGIGKPIVDGGEVFLGAAKIAYFGHGFMAEDRGIIFRGSNILTERNPQRHQWVMLPEDDEGLGSPNGPVCDEHNLVALSDGSLYAMARTIEGHPVHYYSRDRGRTWTRPEYATYTPGGRRFRHPRACPRIWKTSNGKFLFWFHNNGHRWYNQAEATGSRNIAWLSAGTESNGRIHWTQPEIVRYVDNLAEGCSYPDLIEQHGRYFLAASQKTSARVGDIPADWLATLWDQPNRKTLSRKDLLVELAGRDLKAGSQIAMPPLARLDQGGGFTLDFVVRMTYAEPGQVLLDSRAGPEGPGVTVVTTARHALELAISDGRRRFRWSSDPGLVGPDAPHHVTFIVDGGPKVISVVVDGLLCDGGDSDDRKYGYGRFVESLYPSRDPREAVLKEEMADVTGGARLKILPQVHRGAELLGLRIYGRALMTTEAVGNFRASRK